MSEFFIFVEPQYRLRGRTYEQKIKAIFLVDTSGSMFSRIVAKLNLQGELAEMYAKDFALSVAFAILKELTARGEVVGYFGFFSDRPEFEYGGPLCPPRHISGDYFRLNATGGCLEEILRRGYMAVRTATGGTDPNPLLRFLLDRFRPEYGGEPDLIVIVTDGFTPPIEIPTRQSRVYIFIVPGGTTPEVKSAGSKVEVSFVGV